MIPSALTTQLQQGLADFLRYTFWSSTPGMEQVVEDLLAQDGGVLKGPFVSVKLPFLAGRNPRFFPDLPLGFTPHAHQEQAFERLGGRRKRSTLVATGTGSGKTESFLLPILDHCLQEAGQGVKAILVYPMNALATDQALRIARMIHGNDRLRGTVRAGLYIGESRGRKGPTSGTMGPDRVITDREAMRKHPPDILLTNYKMLDYLLLRPADQGVWRHNGRGTLRFLVVDEIHTFDGAQGTDLACLVRRMKRRLQVDDGSLCCVGTSATLGGPQAAGALLRYAREVFGEPFEEDAVIGESRLPSADFLGPDKARFHDEPGAADREVLDPARAADPEAWLRAQVGLWFGEVHEAPDPDAWAVGLGERLRDHTTFRGLLRRLGTRAMAVDDLVADLGRSRSGWREDRALGRLILSSLLALASAARSWRAELPEVRAAREAAGQPRPVERFVEVRVQLWQRELARMVATVDERPRLVHSDDLDLHAGRRHLPLAHCRECGSMGWVTRVDRDKPHLLRSELNALYRAFFGADPRVELLYPRAAVPVGDPAWKGATPARVELDTLTALGPGEESLGPTLEVVRVRNVRSTPRGEELSRDCPFCEASDSLTLVGSRAASLTSVYIDQLFASRFNDDKKLLTFSDSVQDAAHRAGFFGARTWRTNLRVAMLQVIAAHDGLTVAELASRLGEAWKARLDTPTWVATFLAPSMAWLHDWDALKKSGELPQDSDLPELVARRLAYEVQNEFGLQSGIGRSLGRTGSVAVALDPAALDRAVEALLEPLRNEVPGLRDLQPDRLRRFIVGLAAHLRQRGGILSPSLPPGYLESAGHDVHAFTRSHFLPAFGRTSRLPVLLVDRPGRGRFDTWAKRGWYAAWVERALCEGALGADAASVYPLLLPGLVRAGLLKEATGRKGERIWGLNEAALRLTLQGQPLRCGRCGTRAFAAEPWEGMPCLAPRCGGRWQPDARPTRDTFGHLYASGDLQRIFAEEHTGLLEREKREEVESQFKARDRRPWFPNLLSCTPTLEMGIDVGDLSTVVLCSVPPRQASYLQRIGRAGRRDGNAFVLTVANARPHDLYFYAEPHEMMEGEVAPPGIVLGAPAVLERQLTAFCFDRWVAEKGEQAELPPMLKDVFAHLENPHPGRFPFNFFAFIEAHEPRLLREFLEMFAGAATTELGPHLERFLVGTEEGGANLRWRILEALRREATQRDSLSQKARALRELIKQLKQDEARPLDWEEQLDRLESEKAALIALVRGIHKRMTLEFLTDEGLLPNYAFPESAVKLQSVIWRKKKRIPKDGSKFDTWEYTYSRAPASAISELAPHADFYAGGRRVRIDQVDVTVSEFETWRFCDACNHAERIDIKGDESPTCPACRSATWADEGQKVRMMRLRQVFANAPDKSSRIRDDQDDRRPRFFQRQMLVDIEDQDRGGAWQLEDPQLPFGFEFLKRATFREVNFGELTDEGHKFLVAGKEAVRRGFEICGRCGKVQDPKADEPAHSFACPSRKKGIKPKIEPCLYLYREFASEALRMLLPVAELSTRQQLNSFVAALQVGLKARFGGSVDHLRTTVYSDPVEDSALRKQYLVLFDTVPGGTGYLKQLVTPEQGEMPLFQALRLALERIEGCVCRADPERDGCYRCLYAYRNARDQKDTSAQTAIKLLRGILERRDKLQAIGSLGEISITGLLDSVLEARFLEALRQARHNGTSARLKPAMVNHKSAYRWMLGDTEWLVEPQVDLGPGEGIPVSIDFVLRPASASSTRKPIAVFLDGWAFHQDRIDHDLRQRMALQATGRWDTWTLTWADLDEVLLEGPPEQDRVELAVRDPELLKRLLAGAELGRHEDLYRLPLFSLLVEELIEPRPWRKLGQALLLAQLYPPSPKARAEWEALTAEHAPTPLPALHHSAVFDGGSPFVRVGVTSNGTAYTLLATLDDRPEQLDHPEFKAAWRGYLRLFQLVRHVPDAWFVTRRGAEDLHRYAPIVRLRQPLPTGDWSCLDDVQPPFRPLAERLAQQGAPEPAVGMDLPDLRGETWAEAELLWEAPRLAIASRQTTAAARGELDPTWTVLYLEDLGDDPAPVLQALAAGASA